MDYFAEDFYCENCGSMTAIHIKNLNQVRCMGCDAVFQHSKPWTLVDKYNEYTEKAPFPPTGREELIERW